MKKMNVIKALFFGLFFIVSMYALGMQVEAKNWNDKPSAFVESIHEMDQHREDEISCEKRNVGSDKDSNCKAKEWNIPVENLENTFVNEEKKFVAFKSEEDIETYVWIGLKRARIILYERKNEVKIWLKNTFTEWIRVLDDEIRKSIQVSQEWIFDGSKGTDVDELSNTSEKQKEPLKASKDTRGKKDADNHLKEVSWFPFDVKKVEEKEEKQSKKNNRKRRSRNKKNLENKNNVYVNSVIRNHVEVVYFALGKEKEWITRIETIF